MQEAVVDEGGTQSKFLAQAHQGNHGYPGG